MTLVITNLLRIQVLVNMQLNIIAYTYTLLAVVISHINNGDFGKNARNMNT